MFGHSRPHEAKSSASTDRCRTVVGRCSKKQAESEKERPRATIVVTRTKGEDLRWLDAFPDLDVTVFNRFGLDQLLPTPRENLNMINQEGDPLFEKLGHEDGMLRYIVDTYDELNDVTIFLQGWPFNLCADVRGLVNRALQNVRRPSDIDMISNGAEDGLIPLTSTFLQYDVEEGLLGYAQDLVRADKSLTQGIGAEALASLNFNKTCGKVLRRRCNSTLWAAKGSQWVVTRERIQMTPKEDYEHALQVAPGVGGKMKEHVLEAVWPMLWGSESWAPGLAPTRPAAEKNPQVKNTFAAMNHMCVFGTDGGEEKTCEEDAGFCLYSKAKGKGADPRARVELKPKVKTSRLHGVCPSGYTFDDGHLPAGENLGGPIPKKQENIILCADACDKQDGCRSFQWSAKTKLCMLKKAGVPTAARKGDFVFCRSDLVPESEVPEYKPENKVAEFLQGKISAPRAREQRAEEEERDIFLRVDKAFTGDESKVQDRRLFCSSKSLAPPPLAVVDKKWRLVDVGYPYYHVQVADFTDCLLDPAVRSKKQVLPCTSNKDSIRWELKKTDTSDGFQLVSKSGKCLIRREEGVSVKTCEPSDERQIFRLDLDRTGKYYEKMSMDMIITPQGRLHLGCLTQLNGQSELLEPHGVQKSQIVHWHVVNGSRFHGPGAYFLGKERADGKLDFLSCRGEKKKPEVVLQSTGFPWFLREGKDGAFTIESQDGSMLQWDSKHGGLFCFDGGKDGDLDDPLLFTLGIPGAFKVPTAEQVARLAAVQPMNVQ